MIPDAELRFRKVRTCTECAKHSAHCSTRKACDPVRKVLPKYDGIRFTSDGFDCALPVSIDSHSVCSYGCLYCFADNLIEHRTGKDRPVGQTSLAAVEGLFSGETDSKMTMLMRKALHYDSKRNGFPCAVQVGALTDTCDNIERQQGWLLRLIDLAVKYDQPLRISTKGTLLANPEYLAHLVKKFWVAFSIVTPDDEMIALLDARAPNATERLATMKALSAIGVTTSLRLRPMMPGVSDRTPKYPHAWRTLLDRARAAGASAVSYEVAFVPGGLTVDLQRRWGEIETILQTPMRSIYYAFGPRQACTRPSAAWTENIMHAVAEHAHKIGLAVGVSDPAWKQLGDFGCCCGISPAHPVFGNWQRENATNALLHARDTGKLVHAADVVPPWAHEIRCQALVAFPAGPESKIRTARETWADKLLENFNGFNRQRSVLNYFQGALAYAGHDKEGNALYRYKGLQRRHPKDVPYWKV